MQVCITQREGSRYFSRFKKINERDRLEVELTIEDTSRVFSFDLTDVLFERFAEHPQILGKRKVQREELVQAVQAVEPIVKRKAAAKPAKPEPLPVQKPKKSGAKPVVDTVAEAAEPKPVKARPKSSKSAKPEPKAIPEVKATAPKRAKKAVEPVAAAPQAKKPARKASAKAVSAITQPPVPAKKPAKPKMETKAAKTARVEVAPTTPRRNGKTVRAEAKPEPPTLPKRRASSTRKPVKV
jgi:hypothetical protein